MCGGGWGGGIHTEGGAHTRQCIHKAVHTQGGLWPPQESCYLRGVWGLAPRVKRSKPRQEKVWRSTNKAVHTQGGAHTRRSAATAGVLFFEGDAGAPVLGVASQGGGGGKGAGVRGGR